MPIGNSVRISIAIFSYLDTFPFGVTADYDAVPDLDVLSTASAGARRAGKDE